MLPKFMRVTFTAPSVFALLSLAACSERPAARLPDVDAGVICASCGGCEEHLPVTAPAVHLPPPIDYPDPPPVGGPHSQCWGDWGVHDTELKPENWVHNLEHGGIVLLYRCEDGCESDVASLRAFVAEHQRTLLTSYSLLPQRFAVVAWEHRLVSECVDLEAIERFYDARYEHGLEDIPDAPPVYCDEHPEL